MAILTNAHLTYGEYDDAPALRQKCLANLHRLPSATGEPAMDEYGVVSILSFLRHVVVKTPNLPPSHHLFWLPMSYS
jgi:hypothetical protein